MSNTEHSRLIESKDVDSEVLADNLRDLADALDNGEALLNRVGCSNSADIEEGVESSLTLDYTVTSEHTHLIHPVEYRSDG